MPAGRSGYPSHPVQHPQGTGLQPRRGARPRMIRLGVAAQESILLVMGYVAQTTGAEPTQEEIAAVLKSYFTLNEVCNQIKFLRKKPPDETEEHAASEARRASLRINLGSCPPKNSLARAGFFIPSIEEGFAAIGKHAKASHGVEPSEDEIARSLRSSFILSELKNQILHLRKQARKAVRS